MRDYRQGRRRVWKSRGRGTPEPSSNPRPFEGEGFYSCQNLAGGGGRSTGSDCPDEQGKLQGGVGVKKNSEIAHCNFPSIQFVASLFRPVPRGMSTFPSISEGGNQWALVSLPRIHSPNSPNTRLVEQVSSY